MKLSFLFKNVCSRTHSFICGYGLSANKLKLIAVLFMTLDHISAYGINSNVIGGFDIYRILGRIAFPIFLFVLVNSVHYTKNKLKFILRLYIANLAVSLLNTFVNLCFTDFFGIHRHFEILSTFCLTVLYIVLIENIIRYFKSDKIKLFLNIAIILAVTFVPKFIFDYGVVDKIVSVQNPFIFSEIRDTFNALIPNFWLISYTPIFIVLGVLWYFFNNKILQVAFLCAFSIFSYIGISHMVEWNVFLDFFGAIQYMMILAVPFILLYNRQKGKSMKWFFYAYYPLHIYAIIFVSKMLNQ